MEMLSEINWNFRIPIRISTKFRIKVGKEGGSRRYTGCTTWQKILKKANAKRNTIGERGDLGETQDDE